MPDSRLAFLFVEGLLLAATATVGGPFWTLPLAVAATAIGFVDLRPAAVASLLPAFGWLAASLVTGNRELFFPYCMHLAGQVAASQGATSRGVVRSERAVARAGGVPGAIAVVATFLAIRVVQHATPRVLLVEAAAATAILVATALASGLRARLSSESRLGGLLVAAGTAALGYAALAL